MHQCAATISATSVFILFFLLLSTTLPLNDATLTTEVRPSENNDVLFITAIRTSQYFNDNWKSRNTVGTFRLFRSHLNTTRDLVVVVVVDSHITASKLSDLRSDLINFDAIIIFYGYADIGGETPLFQYAFRALSSHSNNLDVRRVMYVSSGVFFLRDPTNLLLNLAHSRSSNLVEESSAEVLCIAISSDVLPPVQSTITKLDTRLGSSQSTDPPVNIEPDADQISTCGSDIIYFHSAVDLFNLKSAVDSILDRLSSTSSLFTGATGVDNMMSTAPYLDDAIFFRALYHAKITQIYLPTLEGISVVSERCSSKPADCDAKQDLFLVVFPRMLVTPPEALVRNIDHYMLDLTVSQTTQELIQAVLIIADDKKCSADFSFFPVSDHPWTAAAIENIIASSHIICHVLAHTHNVIPYSDFLELGVAESRRHSLIWNTGKSILQTNDIYPLTNSDLKTNIKSSISISEGVTFLKQNSLNMPTLLRIAVSAEAETLSRIRELLELFEGVPVTERENILGRVPCVFFVESSNEPRIISTKSASLCQNLPVKLIRRLEMLGLLPAVEWCRSQAAGSIDFLAFGTHCPTRHFHRVRPLVPGSVAMFFPRGDSYMQSPSLDRILTGLNRDDPMVFAEVADSVGDEFRIFDGILPENMIDLLVGRLLNHNQILQPVGANSFFIPFDDTPPRSLIESYILNHIAPLVVGSQETARKNGFIGVEWWSQQRDSMDPKEYHMDTAITWCRDNGWPENLLPNCHFYPAIGSVVYLTDEGGPTAVFNQTSGHYGLSPTMPSEVALIFPKRNRMMLFRGSLYHGVMRKTSCEPGAICRPRVTLLVNYWRDKSAGENYAPTVAQEQLYASQYSELLSSHYKEVVNKSLGDDATSRPRKLVNIPLDRDFSSDFSEWKQQRIPEFFIDTLCASYKQFYYNDGSKMHCPMNVPIEPVSCSLSDLNHCIGQFNDSEHISISEQQHPAVLFQLPESKVEQYIKSVSDEFLYFETWPKWTFDESNNLVMQLLGKGDEFRRRAAEWRDSMPGGGPLWSKNKSSMFIP